MISDIHCQFKQVENLIAAIKKNKYDAVLYSGDYCNLDGKEAKDKHTIKEFEENVTKILGLVQKGVNVDQSMIFYVPGNHDHIEMFDKSYQLEGYQLVEF